MAMIISLINSTNFMPTPITCPACQQAQILIEQAPDSYANQARCLACGFTCWLKHLKNIAKCSINLKAK